MSGAPALPPVTRADVLDDQVFFDRNPDRRYHLGERWVTRRLGRDTYLRTPLPSQHRYVDTEAAAERAWWHCAWPDLDPKTRDELAKAARRSTKAARASQLRTGAVRRAPSRPLKRG